MYIQLNSQVLYYEHCGEGTKSIILLHGNGETHEIFDRLTEALLPDYDIYAIDSRGQGLSATPKEYHYDDMATDLLNFIDALKIENPAVFGFSDGGITALIAAASRPEVFERIIAAGANSNPRGLSHAARSEIKKQFKKDGSPLTGMMLKEPDLTEDMLKRITCPVLLLAGQRDMVKEKDTKKMGSAIPDCEVRILPGEDHGSYVLHSTKCAQYL